MPSSPATRRKAEARAQSIEQIVDAARPSWRRAAGDIRDEILRHLKSGLSIDSAIARSVKPLQAAITDAMIAGDLKGRLDVTNSVAAVPRRLSLIDDSITFLRRRLELDDGDIQRLHDLYGPHATDVTADFSRSLNQELSAAIAESNRAGEHVGAGIERVREAFDRMGVGHQEDYTLEAIFRTQTQLSYGGAEWNGFQDPEIQDILWGYQYATVGDDRVRPEHEAMDGTRLPKDDLFWKSNWPPNGWNCRCSALPIYRDEFDEGPDSVPAAPRMIGDRLVEPAADKGWDFNPGLVFRDVLRKAASLDVNNCSHLRGRARVLWGLNKLGGQALQRDIARTIKRNKGTVSIIITDLAERGFVKHDPASHGCSLTDKGRAAVAGMV